VSLYKLNICALYNRLIRKFLGAAIWFFVSGIMFLSRWIPQKTIDYIFEKVRNEPGIELIKWNDVFIIGRPKRTSEVCSLLVRLQSKGIRLREKNSRIICVDTNALTLSYEMYFPGRFIIVGDSEPFGILTIYKILVRNWQRGENVGFFRWRRQIECKMEFFYDKAKSIFEHL